ncbi:porin [Pedobacter deserti]|uniref:porin n=1 Tax=Pedobacter deserti TaxID=2817382 RepID=UPI00210B243F|nr:porin [Pedobacter sp. SYSU D00382]
MKNFLILAVLLTMGSTVSGQEPQKVKLSAYLETYFGYDFDKPADNNRPGFVYSHNRHNEVNLNLGFIKASYEDGPIRANLALMAGTYTNANLAAEPDVLKNLFEANVGVRLSTKSNLWLDAGIFSSHIGFESAVSKDCWVLTRNISSENTPYYESGAKLTYGSDDGRFTAAVLYLNGWQRITRQNGNSRPAGGLQLTWKPAPAITVNYSNYLGTEGADSVRVTRFYHNVYGIFSVTEKLGLTLGFDYGTQQRVKGSDDKHEVLSPVIIARYALAPKWAMAGRLEYYEDRNGMLIVANTPEGFKTTGYSLNVDYSPVSNAVVRLEGKMYKNDGVLTASLAVAF